jgi:hypothetical protein
MGQSHRAETIYLFRMLYYYTIGDRLICKELNKECDILE